MRAGSTSWLTQFKPKRPTGRRRGASFPGLMMAGQKGNEHEQERNLQQKNPPIDGKNHQNMQKNKIAFAAQFMMDETGFYISSYTKGPGGVHITEVVEEMLFTSIDKYDQKITNRGVCFQGNWYSDEHLMMHIGEEVRLMYSNGCLEVTSQNLPFEIITTLCL